MNNIQIYLTMLFFNLVTIGIYDYYLVTKVNNAMEKHTRKLNKQFDDIDIDIMKLKSKQERFRDFQINVTNNYLPKIK